MQQQQQQQHHQVMRGEDGTVRWKRRAGGRFLLVLVALMTLTSSSSSIGVAAQRDHQQNQQQQQQQLKGEQEDPCRSKARVVSDVTYCDRYWECVEGRAELYNCPNGLVFAGKHRGVTDGCDYPWRSDYCEGKQQANPPISTEHCDWLYGIFGHETSCTRYWTCWNGTAAEQLCIGGLLYNERSHSCDWPENVDGCQKHPLCHSDPNGNVPLGKSCNRYWQCQGGYPRLQRCPAMLVFDRRSLRCVVPPTEDCDVPSTPTPDRDGGDNRKQQDDGEGPQLPALPPGAIPIPNGGAKLRRPN